MAFGFFFDVLLFLLFAVGLGLYIYARASLRAELANRARSEVKRRSGTIQPKLPRMVAGMSLSMLGKLGARIPLFSGEQRAEASSKLVMAGYRSQAAVLILTGVSIISVVALMFLTWLLVWPILQDASPVLPVGALGLAAYLGALLPRLVLDRIVARRQEAIRLALPDALDLLVIITNAGLALNPAMQRVANEMRFAAPALADEFELTATELQLSSDTEQVLNRLAKRVDIDSMRSLVNTMLQARQYGTPITKALRILAKTERTSRLLRIEEQAAKLAVKMTVPMMLFILPTVIIVGAGPAIINMADFLIGP